MSRYKTRQEGPDRLEDRTCECGNTYTIKVPSEEWKTSCYECWKLRKERAEELFRRRYQSYKEPDQFTQKGNSTVEKELRDNVRSLLQLCHPDKHNGSELSVRITQWLLKIKSL